MHQLRRFVAALTMMTLLLLSIVPVQAQQGPSGSGLSISPTLSEYTLKPGQADKLDITLKNVTINDITAQSFINDFKADNTTGSPQIITDTTKISPNSIRKFIIGLDDVPLRVQEQKKITLAIQIPKDTPPGAYFGVIRYKAVPAGLNAPKEGEVALSASVGTIVLITVPGNLKEQVQLSDLHIYSGRSTGTFFFSKPTDVGVEVRNLGNGFAKPFGTVEVTKLFGDKTVYTYQINNTNPRGTVLPSSSRIFKNPIKNINQVGHYTVTASLTYGSGSDVLVLKKAFWYVPGWLVAVIGAGLLILLLLTYRAYWRYRQGVKRSYRRKG